MTLFRDKYRIESARYEPWDYRWVGAYFITICTDHHRNHYFGKIVDDKMQLSNVGVIADLLWYEIKNRASYVRLGEFVVMPNHMHGILIIYKDTKNVETLHATSTPDIPQINDVNRENVDNGENEKNVGNGENVNDDVENAHNVKNAHSIAQTLHATSLPPMAGKSKFMSDISPKPHSISTIIRSYKSAVTKHANRLNLKCKWQTRFHDHIIRNEESFDRISNYIINNPANWDKDRFYV